MLTPHASSHNLILLFYNILRFFFEPSPISEEKAKDGRRPLMGVWRNWMESKLMKTLLPSKSSVATILIPAPQVTPYKTLHPSAHFKITPNNTSATEGHTHYAFEQYRHNPATFLPHLWLPDKTQGKGDCVIIPLQERPQEPGSASIACSYSPLTVPTATERTAVKTSYIHNTS